MSEKQFWPIGNEEEVLAESLRRLEANQLASGQGASIDATLTEQRLAMCSLDDVHDILRQVWARSMSADEAVENFSALGWMRYDEAGNLVGCVEGDDDAFPIFRLSA